MIAQAVQNVFGQLSASLQQLRPDQYTQPCVHLFNATIGQHVRHIIELFQCLENGYEAGTVNYEKRKRDVVIESDMDTAINLLHHIQSGIDRPNKSLTLETCYDEGSADMISIESNYHREVAYNLEHTIHHMALIRVGLNEMGSIDVPANYGVASSTTKYQQSCAQ